ncbi:MAG: hypothetical protein ETSY1_14805 [Candidatus Entotheonella factor]|uniref:Orc1-like AAA ATPase domain-containing protein n=1 Tax=Entotheonella factor TaxID=1429438 RepID=W4LN17_ENTF1|nr:MAG: hypothetical protein ETSY1_14805 [Candidatus Entotheonella factor]
MAEVYRVEGFVAQIAGHGFIALFRAPIACEDHVLRALRAAFNLRQASTQLISPWSIRPNLAFNLHMALHTGPILVDHLDSTLPGQALAQGLTCQIAMHIQQQIAIAKLDNMIFVSEAVRQQAPGFFEFIDYASLTVPMVGQPMRVSTCPGPLSVRCRLDVSLARQHTVFCGRQHEMTLLRALWERACKAEGQVICLIGEAGIGKSRLAYEYRQSLDHVRLLTIQA